MSQSNRRHVPAKTFAPQKARNDVNQEHPKMPLIALNVPLMDLIEHGASVVHGANDLVFRGAPYKEYRLYLTWPGYTPQEPINVNIEAGGSPPTRATVGRHAARLFVRYLSRCQKDGEVNPYRQWRLGGLGDGLLTPYNIVLKALVNTYENVWQIDCDIDLGLGR